MQTYAVSDNLHFAGRLNAGVDGVDDPVPQQGGAWE
jgi:hypothetical protein